MRITNQNLNFRVPSDLLADFYDHAVEQYGDGVQLSTVVRGMMVAYAWKEKIPHVAEALDPKGLDEQYRDHLKRRLEKIDSEKRVDTETAPTA